MCEFSAPITFRTTPSSEMLILVLLTLVFGAENKAQCVESCPSFRECEDVKVWLSHFILSGNMALGNEIIGLNLQSISRYSFNTFLVLSSKHFCLAFIHKLI